MYPVGYCGGMHWLLVILACSEFRLDPIDPPGPPPVVVSVVERFVQSPASKVDLLIVVDDTASMQLELQALADQLPALIQTLDASGLDWQVGVVSAAIDSTWPGYLLGSPYVITPAHPDPQGAFRARLPTSGGTGEAGLEAARLALELASVDGPNAGFRRAGALLQVLFVSDADDQSPGPDPVGDLLATLQGSEGAGQARISALVGDVPGGCASPSGTAQAGFRYHELVESTGGVAGSICSIDFNSLLTDLADDSVELPVAFPLAGVPLPNSIVATVDTVPQAFQYDDVQVAVVFDEAPPSGALVEVRYARREAVE